jgi:hypothetical protein
VASSRVKDIVDAFMAGCDHVLGTQSIYEIVEAKIVDDALAGVRSPMARNDLSRSSKMCPGEAKIVKIQFYTSGIEVELDRPGVVSSA